MSFSNTALLRHILDEAEFILQQTEGLTLDKLEEDKVLQRAFIRSISVIGEASKNIEAGFRTKYPELDWRNMARMRDRLIHHYFDIDLEVVYQTCMNDIPELYTNIKAILLLEEKNNDNSI